MLRRTACGFALAALGALAAACGSSNTITTPTPIQVTEVFSGPLIGASAAVSTFTTLTGGTVTATLTTIGPDNTKTVGFSLGTFNTSLNTCTVILDNSAAPQAFAFTANTTSIGTYCVRVYDNGSVTADGVPYTYTITVVHPQ